MYNTHLQTNSTLTSQRKESNKKVSKRLRIFMLSMNYRSKIKSFFKYTYRNRRRLYYVNGQQPRGVVCKISTQKK